MDLMETEYSSSHALLHRRVRAGALWFGVLCGPLAAFANEQFEYLTTAWSCGRFDSVSRILLHLIPLSLIVLCVIAGLVSWRGRTSPIDVDDEHYADADRSRRGFMSMVGLGLSVFGVLAILAQWIPVWYISPCMFL
jgi:hypothetical protein